MNINTASSLIAAQIYSDIRALEASRSLAQPEVKNRVEIPHRRQGTLVAFTMAGAMALAMTGCDKARQPVGTYIAPPQGLTTRDASILTSTDAASTNAYVHPTAPGGGGYLLRRGYYPVYAQPGYYYRPTPGTTVQMMTVSESFGGNEGGISRGGFGGGESGEGGHGGGGE